MRLLFLRLDIGKEAGVGGLATFWNGGQWDEVDGVGVALAIVIDDLVEAAILPRIFHAPGCSVGAAE